MSKNRKDDQNNLGRYGLWLMILLVGITVGVFITSKDRPEASVSKELPILFSMATVDVARQFACSCGSCGEENLSTCTCPTAKSTKQFIEMNLNNGVSEEDVIELIKSTHGHFLG